MRSHLYNGVVTIVLALTVWFANFAEALAEGRGKAKAESLRQTSASSSAFACAMTDARRRSRRPSCARAISCGSSKNDVMPADGEVVEGVAYVNESAITGESAPVLKEPGTDMFSSVTAGTTVISDWLLFRVTVNPGQTFLDRMIQLVEAAKRQKTPNEIALTVLLSVLTLIFVIVVATMAPVAVLSRGADQRRRSGRAPRCADSDDNRRALSAIGIAGIDRTMRFNVLATSGKAVEAAGDVQTLILDKTGTITIGNREAREFLPVAGTDATGAGSSGLPCILFRHHAGGTKRGHFASNAQGAEPIPGLERAHGLDFSAHTRMSGIDLPDGRMIRKGAVSAIVGDGTSNIRPDGALRSSRHRRRRFAKGRHAARSERRWRHPRHRRPFGHAKTRHP